MICGTHLSPFLKQVINLKIFPKSKILLGWGNLSLIVTLTVLVLRVWRGGKGLLGRVWERGGREAGGCEAVIMMLDGDPFSQPLHGMIATFVTSFWVQVFLTDPWSTQRCK